MLFAPALVRPVEPGFHPAGTFAGLSEDAVLALALPREDGRDSRVYDARTWTSGGREVLLALVGVAGDTFTAENGLLHCELLVVGRQGRRFAVLAREPDAGDCGGASSARLDLAPYDLDAKTRLFGVRSEMMNHGWHQETLRLFWLRRATVAQVFERIMLYSEDQGDEDHAPHEARAILRVERRPSGSNVFVVEERSEANGTRRVERWGWNGTAFGLDAKVR